MEPSGENEKREALQRAIESLQRELDLPRHCSYLPNRLSRNLGFQPGHLTPGLYQMLMEQNFRRSGQLIYRPQCDDCNQCRAIRIPADAFRPDRSQRRCRQRNMDLEIRCRRPEPTADKHALYARYLAAQHDGQMNADWDAFTGFLYDSPITTRELEYRKNGTVVSVSLIDLEPEAVSAVYCYYDPRLRHRALGTFNILATIALAALNHLPWVYLGYHIADCPSMNYKARFRPCEVRMPDGQWQRFEAGQPITT